ncbi:hypothetical protein ACLMJK_008341 [Lecanora helva]
MVVGRVLSSQTIGVEFSSKIIKVGTGVHRKRIKLQLWDTAGTERFRSVSRSYYRGAAGAILVYDVASKISFNALPTFLNDARALTSPQLTLLLVGNKVDLASDFPFDSSAADAYSSTLSSNPSRQSTFTSRSIVDDERSRSSQFSAGHSTKSHLTVISTAKGREVASEEASRWASGASIPVSVEVSAFTGEGVEQIFGRLAAMILTKIELGEIDPSDPLSGIQYGDSGVWEDGASSRGSTLSRRKRRETTATGQWASGMREWEAVFRLDGAGRRRRGDCC